MSKSHFDIIISVIISITIITSRRITALRHVKMQVSPRHWQKVFFEYLPVHWRIQTLFFFFLLKKMLKCKPFVFVAAFASVQRESGKKVRICEKKRRKEWETQERRPFTGDGRNRGEGYSFQSWIHWCVSNEKWSLRIVWSGRKMAERRPVWKLNVRDKKPVKERQGDSKKSWIF